MNYFFYILIVLFSKLPLPIIYKITDGLIFLVFNVVGYRKGVIKENIKNSFPEKSDSEVKHIIKNFHKQFSALIAEIIMLISIPKEEHLKRVTFINLDYLKKYEGKKDVIIICGHVMNWEMVSVAQTFFKATFKPVYMKLQNSFWDEKLLHLRSKYGAEPIEMQKTVETIKSTSNDGKNFYFVVGDQSPHISKAKYSLKFLGRETPIFVGYDFLAQNKNLPVFYLEINSIKRGFYQFKLNPIMPKNGTHFQELEISYQFFEMLEKTIHKNPSNYLWTHKRWKHKKGVDY